MVKCFTLHKSTKVMSKGTWYVLGTVLQLLMAIPSSTSLRESQLSDVDGEEGRIDQLEAFLESRGPKHKNLVGSNIEFGVGPKDPRFFIGSPNDSGGPKFRSLDDISSQYIKRKNYLSGRNNRVMTYDDMDGDPLYDLRSGYIVNGLQDERQAANARSGEKLPNKIVATSQPESVLYVHSDPLARKDDKPKNKTKEEYNLNDPSSNVNIDVGKAALPGSVESAPAQNYQHHQHSAHAGQPSVVAAQGGGGFTDFYFTALVVGCSAAAVCLIVGTGVCFYKVKSKRNSAKDMEYPAYGVTGPSRDLSPGSGSGGGDRTLAHSAQMYHYQQQKKQMIAIDKSGVGDASGGGRASDDSEEEVEERDYTVYECPGLAPMNDMVVPNPMYPADEGSPGTPTLRALERERDGEY